MFFKPLNRMWERVEIYQDQSDTDLFNALMYTGEMLTKLAISGMVAAITNDRDRHRYRQQYILVRADGLGDWVHVLDDTLTGPPAQYLFQEAYEEQNQLIKNYSVGSWQFESVAALNNCLRIVYPECELLGQKIQGRRWFLIFTQLRNKTRAHGAPTTDQLAAACPILMESIRMFAENFQLFRRPWAYLYKSLSGRYRVTRWTDSAVSLDPLKTQFGQRYNFKNGVYIHFDTTETFSALARVDLVESDSEATDFFVANGGFTEQRYEMLSYFSGNKKSENSSQYLIPVTELPPSETQGLEALEVRQNSFTTLPPLHKEYIHRSQLERELFRELMEADYHRIVTLVGRGGIGKTSLALSVLNDISKSGKFTAIFWFSARDIDLRPDGPKQVRPHILTEKDIAHEFARLVLKREEYEARGFDAQEFLNRSLTKSGLGPLLFIFDNFETVRNPVELYNGIDTYLRPPNKALITTRLRDFRGDYPIEVGGMSEEEAEELVNTTATKLGIQSLLTSDYCHDLFEESDGHPYVIKVMLGEVAKEHRLVKVTRVVASQDKILDALFERTYSVLSPAAQRVFLTLCNWRSIVPLLALQAVLIKKEGERIDVEGAIDELEKSSFIEVIESGDNEELFLDVPLVASVFGKRKLAVNPLSSAIEADTQLLRYFGASQEAQIKQGVGPRVERLFKNILDDVAQGKASLDEYKPMIEFIASKHPNAWLLLADLYEEVHGDASVQDAKEAVRRALQDSDRLANPWNAWEKLANLSFRTGDYLGEVHALVNMCQLPGTWFIHVSNTVNKINQYLNRGTIALNLYERRALVEPLIEIMKRRIDIEGDATDCSRLAWLYLNLQYSDEARYFTQKGLNIDPNNDYCLSLGDSLFR